MSKKKIEVSLFGQRFTVRSEHDEEYVHKLARFVSTQIEDIRKQTRTVSTHHLLLLVALNLADEIQQRDRKISFLNDELAAKTKLALQEIRHMKSMLPPDTRTPIESIDAQQAPASDSQQ